MTTAVKLALAATIAAPVALYPIAAAAAPAADAPHVATTQPAAKVSAKAQKQIDALSRTYLATQQLLVQDKLDGVPENFQKLDDQANALAESDSDLAKQAHAVSQAAANEPKTLDDARTSFKKISAAVTDLLKTAPPDASVATQLYYVTCPMAQAGWLQDSEQIANPYMGQAEPTCGIVEQTIHTRSN